MAESPAQSAVCVIGHPIGGNPSQFCITRVFDDWELDWQCLSFDVTPESLAAALLGVEALGFVGGLIASPHELAAAKRFGERASLTQRPRGRASLDAMATSMGTPAAQLQTPSAAAGVHSVNPARGNLPDAADVPAEGRRWIDGLRREPTGGLVGCNFLAEAVDDLLGEHRRRTGQPLAACLFLGDIAALESATLPFESCLPPLRYQTAADGSLVVRPGLLPPSDASAGPVPALESLSEPLLVLRMPLPEKPSLKAKGTATPREDRRELGSLPHAFHPDSLIFDLAGSFAPGVIPRGPSPRSPRSLTPLDLEVARLVAAIRSWTGQVADRALLAEAIEEYLEI
jgi:hypothetical protein